GRRPHLDLDCLSHRAPVRRRRHHRAPRFPRGPRALRDQPRDAPRPSDQPAHRRGDRISVGRDRKAAGRSRPSAWLQAGRPPARALRRPAGRKKIKPMARGLIVAVVFFTMTPLLIATQWLLTKLRLPGWGVIAVAYYRFLCLSLRMRVRIVGEPVRDR